MKALLIIFGCILLATAFKAIEYFLGRNRINSVGAKSNRKSMDIAKIDINDEAQLKEALDYYKNLTD